MANKDKESVLDLAKYTDQRVRVRFQVNARASFKIIILCLY